MNDDMKNPDRGEPNPHDETDHNLITDFTQVVSCAVGKDRHEYRRQMIREELVRDHIDQAQSVSPPIRSRLLKLFKLD